VLVGSSAVWTEGELGASMSLGLGRFLRRCEKSCVSVARPLIRPEMAAIVPTMGASAPSWVSRSFSMPFGIVELMAGIESETYTIVCGVAYGVQSVE
jgi:hypothetical protein